jgi:2-polyprenyl-3-methyl-5-hydroxy-6-metoxy-1,4-benzoquinol methylase
MAEFTGERLVPGQVEPDLYNEHVARYLFALPLVRGQYLDLGCGTGYGTSLVAERTAKTSADVTGVDVSAEALDYARQHYSNVNFQAADATNTGLPSETYQTITAFELIEHLTDWSALLKEAKRLLSSEGVFLVSTPNRGFYAETRKESGPNPFHAHEFSRDEFAQALSSFFAHVRMFRQDHQAAQLIHTAMMQTADQNQHSDFGRMQLPQSDNMPNYLIAVCSDQPIAELPSFAYFPSSANLLQEKHQHITLLQTELATKSEWLHRETEAKLLLKQKLDEALSSAQATTDRLHQELRIANEWGAQSAAELRELAKLHQRLETESAAQSLGYEQQIQAMQIDLEAKVAWARGLDEEIQVARQQLERQQHALDQLQAETQALRQSRQALQQEILMAQQSRWIQLGRHLGIGPVFSTDTQEQP